MKEMYVKPAMEMVDVEAAEMLAVSSVAVTSDYADNSTEALINGRRGGWVDLWE